jgi:hypothetical protein
MAAASYTVVTVLDSVKAHVNDIANALGAAGEFDGLGGTGSDDLQYKSMLLNNVMPTGEQTVVLQKRTTGLYTYAGKPNSALWFASNTAPFTGGSFIVPRTPTNQQGTATLFAFATPNTANGNDDGLKMWTFRPSRVQRMNSLARKPSAIIPNWRWNHSGLNQRKRLMLNITGIGPKVIR